MRMTTTTATTRARPDDLGIVAGALFEDPAHRPYRVERVLAHSDDAMTALCATTGGSVVVELWRLESRTSRDVARGRAATLTKAVHPRIPPLRDMFVALPRRRLPVMAAFVFDEPDGVAIRVLFQRLGAVAPETKLVLVLEVARQLFELSAAVEVAGLLLSPAAGAELDRVRVSSGGVIVTPYGTRENVGRHRKRADDVHDGALSVPAVAACAVRLATELGAMPATPGEQRVFEPLRTIATSAARAPLARDMLSWIHAHVPRYERQRFADLTARLAHAYCEDTSPTILRGPPPERHETASLEPFALGPHSFDATTLVIATPVAAAQPSPHVEAEASSAPTLPRAPSLPSPPPATTPHATRGLLVRSAPFVAVMLVAAITTMAGAKHERDRAPARARDQAVVLTMLRAPTEYTSALRKDEMSPRCTSCIDLSGAPAGRRVYVDGVVRGETPLVLPLPCGKHQLRVGSQAAAHVVDVPCEPADEDEE